MPRASIPAAYGDREANSTPTFCHLEPRMFRKAVIKVEEAGWIIFFLIYITGKFACLKYCSVERTFD